MPLGHQGGDDAVAPEGLDETAWLDVIHKMDEVYQQLVRDEIALEEKNAQLEQSQQFILSLLSSMSDVLVAFLPAPVAMNLFSHSPSVARQMLRHLAQKIQRDSEFRALLSINNTSKRIYSYIVLMQKKDADGTVVELKRGADISVEFSKRLRRVVLLRGEAHFQVAKNKDWPFAVDAGGLLAPVSMDNDPAMQAVIDRIGIDAYRFYAAVARGEHPELKGGAVIVPAYSGNLLSYVVSPQQKPIIESVYDIPNVAGLKVAVSRGQGVDLFLQKEALSSSIHIKAHQAKTNGVVINGRRH